MNETTDPRDLPGAFWCPSCERWQEAVERSLYPADSLAGNGPRTGSAGDCYCRDCVAAEVAPP